VTGTGRIQRRVLSTRTRVLGKAKWATWQGGKTVLYLPTGTTLRRLRFFFPKASKPRVQTVPRRRILGASRSHTHGRNVGELMPVVKVKPGYAWIQHQQQSFRFQEHSGPALLWTVVKVPEVQFDGGRKEGPHLHTAHLLH
jgi:hypothetical protein